MKKCLICSVSKSKRCRDCYFKEMQEITTRNCVICEKPLYGFRKKYCSSSCSLKKVV